MAEKLCELRKKDGGGQKDLNVIARRYATVSTDNDTWTYTFTQDYDVVYAENFTHVSNSVYTGNGTTRLVSSANTAYYVCIREIKDVKAGDTIRFYPISVSGNRRIMATIIGA